MASPQFTLTEKQIRALVAITPPGHTVQVTIAFPKDDPKDKPRPADLVDP